MNSGKWLIPVIDTYKTYFTGKLSRIVDVGSRDGDDAQFIAQRLNVRKTCQIICVEAREKAAKIIKEKYPNFIVFETAVSNFVGESSFVEFHEPEFAGSSSLMPERQNTYQSESSIITVPVTRLDIILPTGNIDILKIDVEGYELEVLKGSTNLLEKKFINYIQFEYGGTYLDANQSINDVINFLKSKKYTVYRLHDSRFIEMNYIDDDYQYDNFYATYHKLC